METKTKNSIQKPKVKKRLSQKQVLMIGLGGGVALGLGYLAADLQSELTTQEFAIANEIINTKP